MCIAHSILYTDSNRKLFITASDIASGRSRHEPSHRVQDRDSSIDILHTKIRRLSKKASCPPRCVWSHIIHLTESGGCAGVCVSSAK